MAETETSPDSKTTGTTETVSLRAYAALERELSALKGLIDIRSESDNPGLEDIWLAGQPVGRIIESNRKKADSAREEARATESSGSDPKGTEGENHHTEDELLPIERMIQFREQDEQHPALPSNGRESFERAVSIFEHFMKWSDKTPKGRTITDGIKTLLETVTGERLAWRQIYRAMDKVEEWTNGAIRHETTSRHGHVLVADGQLSSVG